MIINNTNSFKMSEGKKLIKNEFLIQEYIELKRITHENPT